MNLQHKLFKSFASPRLHRFSFVTRPLSTSNKFNPIMLAQRLTLTPNESALFELLTSCAKWIDETNALAPLEDLPDAAPAFINWKAEQDSIGVGRERVQLRVAGGWVRDKVSQPSLSCTATSFALALSCSN
jgi:hypothetical protein